MKVYQKMIHDNHDELTEIAIKAMDNRRMKMKANCRCDAIAAKLTKAAYKAIADENGITEQTAKKRFEIDDQGTLHFCCVQCCDCQFDRVSEYLEINEKDD